MNFGSCAPTNADSSAIIRLNPRESIAISGVKPATGFRLACLAGLRELRMQPQQLGRVLLVVLER